MLKADSKMFHDLCEEGIKDDKKDVFVDAFLEFIAELDEDLEIMKVDNMYGRYKKYGGKTKLERLFATKYGMHDALQELLEGRK